MSGSGIGGVMADDKVVDLLQEIRDILAANASKRDRDSAAHLEQGEQIRTEFLDLKRRESRSRNAAFLTLVAIIGAVVALVLALK